MPYYPPNGGATASSDIRDSILPVPFSWGYGSVSAGSINAVGILGSGGGGEGSTDETIVTTLDRPAMQWLTTSGSAGGYYRGETNSSYRRFNWRPNFWSAFSTGDDITNVNIYSGIWSARPYNGFLKGLGFIRTSENPNWQFIARQNDVANQTLVDTGIAIEPNTYYELYHLWTGPFEVTWSIRKLDGTVVSGIVNTTLPTDNSACGELVQFRTSAAGARKFFLHGLGLSLGNATPS